MASKRCSRVQSWKAVEGSLQRHLLQHRSLRSCLHLPQICCKPQSESREPAGACRGTPGKNRMALSIEEIVNASGPFLWLSGEFCIATVHSQQMGHHLPRKPRTSLIWHPRGETLLKGKTIVRDSITVSVRWKHIEMKPELCCTQWGTNTMWNKQKQDITKAKLYSVEIW